ncbi:glycosyltransferase family 4 protein [Rhizobium sp. BK251]|uniref:glycosyltransferase family 4 protein n=1 Tax=Rhizobium sp. BK251 TaxID=2512125 RepID=UPI0010439349|nr:glycosyltransferase family 4 protein [Rhizobium sp. BK251]TCL73786.1 glycosyltransferase involved in cell wall biosynthesis [Rhizobium sp. BK251]
MKGNSGLRILHLAHTPRHSGAESLIRDLCLLHTDSGIVSAMASFCPPLDEFAGDARRLQDSGVALYFPSTMLSKFGRGAHYRDVYRAFQPDVVFAHSVLPSLYGRLPLALMRERPAFVTVLHAASNDDFDGGYLRRLEGATRWLVDSVVAVSDEGAQNYSKRFGPRASVDVIKNGIDLQRFTQLDRARARQELGIEGQRKMILQVGRLAPAKQQDLSIRALERLLKEQDAELWLAGLTEYEEYERQLRAIALELGVAEKVHFLGARSDVPNLLAATDLYVMPSTREAHSIAIIEALAAGAPVLASDIPAFAFADEFDGVRIVGRDDVAGVAGAAEDLLRLNARFDRDLSRFAIERTADQYAALALRLHERRVALAV